MPSDEYLWRARMENEWADTKAAAKRAEAAEDKLDRAERLAEAVRSQCDAGMYVSAQIREALAAFRSPEPQPAAEPIVKPAEDLAIIAAAESEKIDAEQGCRGFEMNRRPMAAVDQCAHCGRRRREHEGDDLFPARKVSDPQPRE